MVAGNKGGRPALSGKNQRTLLELLEHYESLHGDLEGYDHIDAAYGVNLLAAICGLSSKETRRVLNDLHARGLVTRRPMSDGRSWAYRLAEA